MNTQGPFTLVLNVSQELLDPASNSLPSAAVQIQNSSNYVISVLASGVAYTIQPLIAQTLPLRAEGAPITVTAVQSPGLTAAANTFTAVWLFQGEAPPMQDGPLPFAPSLTGAIQDGHILGVTASGGPVTFMTVGAGKTWTGTITLQCFMFGPAPGAGGATIYKTTASVSLVSGGGTPGTGTYLQCTAGSGATGGGASTATITQPFTFTAGVAPALLQGTIAISTGGGAAGEANIMASGSFS